MYTVIYSTDYNFQILQIGLNISPTHIWDWASDVYHNDLGQCVKGYDVETFEALNELNQWILEQINDTEYVPKSLETFSTT